MCSSLALALALALALTLALALALTLTLTLTLTLALTLTLTLTRTLTRTRTQEMDSGLQAERLQELAARHAQSRGGDSGSASDVEADAEADKLSKATPSKDDACAYASAPMAPTVPGMSWLSVAEVQPRSSGGSPRLNPPPLPSPPRSIWPLTLAPTQVSLLWGQPSVRRALEHIASEPAAIEAYVSDAVVMGVLYSVTATRAAEIEAARASE